MTLTPPLLEILTIVCVGFGLPTDDSDVDFVVAGGLPIAEAKVTKLVELEEPVCVE